MNPRIKRQLIGSILLFAGIVLLAPGIPALTRFLWHGMEFVNDDFESDIVKIIYSAIGGFLLVFSARHLKSYRFHSQDKLFTHLRKRRKVTLPVLRRIMQDNDLEDSWWMMEGFHRSDEPLTLAEVEKELHKGGWGKKHTVRHAGSPLEGKDSYTRVKLK